MAKKSASSTNPERAKGHPMHRNAATIKRLRMYRGGKPVRNKKGKIVKPAEYQGRLPSGTVSRIDPNRKWFGNTRTVAQSTLQEFQEKLGKVVRDPYKVVMKSTKMPVSLLQDYAKTSRVHLLDTHPFEQTFGIKAQRKRPILPTGDLETYLSMAVKSEESYDESKDRTIVTDDADAVRNEAKEKVFTKGQSKRIWNELYKVIDSSDVLIQVLDARDPMGTRSAHIEKYLRKEKVYKHLIFILNKCDLVPTWVTARWIQVLSAEFPTLAFHANIMKPFGKGALIQLLRQFAKLHKDKKQISIGFIGYPNVGKSSIINTLRRRKVCSVAPIAGQTKVWQYIFLMKKINLIDCPGVVYPSGDTETDLVLKGVVRVENVKSPSDFIPAVLERAKGDYIKQTYKVAKWESAEDFLKQLASKSGKLLKGGEPDIDTVAKMVLNDWQRGKIPYFVKPPVKVKHQKNTEVSGEGATSSKETVESIEDVDGSGEEEGDDMESTKTVAGSGAIIARPGKKREMEKREEREKTGGRKRKHKEANASRMRKNKRERGLEDESELAKDAGAQIVEKKGSRKKAKTGVHFYSTISVKNRRRGKKKEFFRNM
ncbi:nucleolar GTP-binding protein 2-like isoform X1 [Oscarella lobularis]|uniref:nucleolar GTP-binding protein 2-like isoform X1 n=1 Tax=Oscarella lobularis TaxID=121494 RepID=UPI0033131315